MTRVVIPDDYPSVFRGSQAWKQLAQLPVEVEWYDSLPESADQLVERLQDAEVALNIRASAKFTASIFERLPDLRLVSIWGTGTDHVDLLAAANTGITVTNTPGVSAVSIAEHCLALMLAVARKIPQIDAQTRAGQWPRGGMMQLAGKTLGVIGLGAIGRRFACLGQAIGMDVITWTRNPKPELGFPHVELDELLGRSDVVSLHLRLSEETRGFLGFNEFARMKSGAIFLNTARGPITDDIALVDALRTGHLFGAGLDVFDIEPLPPTHPLTSLPNVVISPHSAGITPEALEAGLSLAVENIASFLKGIPGNVVQAPPQNS